jgi:hypothetical protein
MGSHQTEEKEPILGVKVFFEAIFNTRQLIFKPFC